MEKERGMTCKTHGRQIYAKFSWKNLRERDHLKNEA
jgi:hypothetical protein